MREKRAKKSSFLKGVLNFVQQKIVAVVVLKN